jgi:sortase A
MRRAIAATGRVLVTVGLLILLFVAFQLWGTGILTARAQSDLRDEFESARRTVATSTTTTSTAAPTSNATGPGAPAVTATTAGPPPVPGDAVATIRIPKIGVDKVVVEGTDREDLKKGPGHFPGTPLPGQVGNAAIAGHRTTYGQPFFDLDQLAPGDEIITEALTGTYTYRVRQTLIVQPEDVWVVANTPDPQLTLTTCNPKFSARERLVVQADLVPAVSAPPVEVSSTNEGEPASNREGLSEGLEGEEKSLGPAYGWGAVAAVVGLAWWWVFRRWPHPLTWLAGVLPFLVVLFVFYTFLERVLPAGL